MSRLKSVLSWLGIAPPSWVNSAIARRNMPVVAMGSVVVALFGIMLVFCLLTGMPCPVDGFDEVVNEEPDKAMRFLVMTLVEIVFLAISFVYSLLYVRRKWDHPIIAMVVTMLFAFTMVSMWGMAEAGVAPVQQLLICASLQFLVAGLLVLCPIVSLLYFGITFSLFGLMMFSFGEIEFVDKGDLFYLAMLDVVVSWIVYGLFIRATERERIIVDKSRRDELTGAKNRHYLRDDFADYVGHDLFVMLCDIDNFKRYNDTYGHDTGDLLLREYFFALRDAFGDPYTYRYGGDEFLIVSPDLDDAGLERCFRIIETQVAKINVEDEVGMVKFSGGYVRSVAHDDSEFRAMLHKADDKLYEAKRAGKNRIVGERLEAGEIRESSV